MAVEPSGRLELTWTNKHLRLLSNEDGGYTWVPPADYRVAEVRLLHDVEEVGETHAERHRAKDNLLIAGDALNALTSLCELPELAREYVGKVKLAYLDPPFNTQQAFEHYDDALEHSVWLTMMRDRLLQIRKLLSPDGSVWVHCDDSEQAYLKVMMDEVFGRQTFVAVVVWQKVYATRNDAKQFSTDHDYLLVYSRNVGGWVPNRLARTARGDSLYKNPDDDPRGPWMSDNYTCAKTAEERPNLYYPITNPTTGEEIWPSRSRVWLHGRDRHETNVRENRVWWGDEGRNKTPRYKRFLSEVPALVPGTWWTYESVGHNQDAKREITALVPDALPFSTPKPERLMQRIIHIASNPGDIVLDCFAGSGTTAAVAHKLGRRWVAVESSRDTIETFTRPRLEKVVTGDDPGRITKDVGWEGGGSFRLLEVAPSMFAEVDGRVWLAPWAVDRELAEATAAQLGYDFEPDPPFAGRKGRTRLAVVDGLVNGDVVELLVGALQPEEKIVVCGTAIDPEASVLLKTLRSGSRTRKIPASILAEYRIARDWRPAPGREPAAVEA
ncbi:MAG: site-specific DNA-methyltransferase [Actinomycetota bacterium]|nr:site-specific DNA-methyltransferase [Actinomycetota bacterium]